jgi:NodT family efflux transporter outer membrane factor (OMF) lipoprotein
MTRTQQCQTPRKVGDTIPESFLNSATPAVLSYFLVLFLLSGCISATKRTTLPVDLPAQFSKSGDISTEQKWWLIFEDSSLNTLIDTALGENLNLLTARDRIVEARAQAAKTGAALSPTLDGAGTASSTRNYQTDVSDDRFSLSVAAGYEIDMWGRLKSIQDAATLEMKATEADYFTSEITLTAEISSTWFTLIENGLQKEQLLQQKDVNSKVLELITVQFRAGKAGIADVLQQRQLIESNNEDLAGLASARKRLMHQLALLLGLPPVSDLPEPDILPKLPPMPVTPLPMDLVLRRPDVLNSSYILQAADSRVAAAVADRLPRLSITADLSTSGDRVSDLFSNWFSNLGANVFGPLVDGGSRKAEVERSSAIARQRYYQYGQTILEALREIEDALVKEEELRATVHSREIQLELATETISHVGTRYRQGAEDYQRVLLALLSQQNLQRDILRGRLALLQNRITLYRAISGPLPAVELLEEPAGFPGSSTADPHIQTPLSSKTIQ